MLLAGIASGPLRRGVLRRVMVATIGILGLVLAARVVVLRFAKHLTVVAGAVCPI